MANFIRRTLILLSVVCLLHLYASPCFALSLFVQKDGNYIIINNDGSVAKDISYKQISNNYIKYKSEYWQNVYHMAQASYSVWSKKHGNGGNFR